MDTITEHTIRLLDITDSLSSIRPDAERLFKVLDLHDALSDLLPSMDNLFHSQSSELLRSIAVNQIISKLADKAIESQLIFENFVLNEQSLSPVALEGIHRLPKYVMRYVGKLCDHKQTLMSLSLSNPPSMDDGGNFSFHVNWIITSVVTNLEVKSKLYKDPTASHFFAMENFNYIIQKIQAHPELKEIVAVDNFNKIIENFKQAKADYLKITFHVVLTCLTYGRLKRYWNLSSGVSRFTDRLNRFNGEFEKLQKNLGKLVVHDFALVLDLRKSIAEMLVIAYTSFLVHTKNVHRPYVKYSVEGIESAIQNFFICNPKC